MSKTTRQGLKEPRDTPRISGTSAEPLNATSRCISPRKGVSYSKSLSHRGSGYNVRKDRSMSPKHTVFVLAQDGKPLTPTTPTKAYKLMKGKQAKPVWNKFSQFGIQMMVETRKETPKTVLGCDFGTKFEGYSLISGKENNLNVMWKLPDKKKLVKKLEERSRLRRARRQRNCRRRECRSNNRSRKGFIAPSQKMIINSRLKCIKEMFKCYPINYTAIEDVRFNHAKKRYGKNFSTVEIGKTFIKKQIEKLGAMVFLYRGFDTEKLREEFDYKKSHKKEAEIFNSHCSDALALATDLTTKEHIEQGKFIVVDDTYRPVRRRLHDTQFSKGGVRYNYSTGNFKGIRKGTLCEYGQIVGGTEKIKVYYRDWTDVPQKGKSLKKIGWLSHHFKTKNGGAIHLPPNSMNLEGVFLPV